MYVDIQLLHFGRCTSPDAIKPKPCATHANVSEQTGSISAGGVPIDIQHKIRSRKLQPCMLPAVVDMGNGQRGSIPGEDNWIPRSNHESNSPRGETSLSPFTVDISSYPFPRRSSRPSQCHKRQSDTRPFRISTSNLSSAQPC